MVTTAEAVGELVGVAYRLHGGIGATGARILRPRKTRKGRKEISMQNIYIAGRITGLEHEEADKHFTHAATIIKRLGHAPLNPFGMVDQAPGRKYNEYLADALNILLKEADAVYFLSNWTESKGARIEWEISRILDMPRYFHAEDIPLVDMAVCGSPITGNLVASAADHVLDRHRIAAARTNK